MVTFVVNNPPFYWSLSSPFDIFLANWYWMCPSTTCFTIDAGYHPIVVISQRLISENFLKILWSILIVMQAVVTCYKCYNSISHNYCSSSFILQFHHIICHVMSWIKAKFNQFSAVSESEYTMWLCIVCTRSMDGFIIKSWYGLSPR